MLGFLHYGLGGGGGGPPINYKNIEIVLSPQPTIIELPNNNNVYNYNNNFSEISKKNFDLNISDKPYILIK